MSCIDVFNGDADGICALHQLRLHTPQPEARLVTGVKRDIGLLDRLVEVHASRITVLDISLDRNRSALERLLGQANHIFYADHHYSGAVPASEALEAHIAPSPQICTSLIIDRLLAGKHRPWALVGAFGDNLDEVAQHAADSIGLTETDTHILREMGRLLNYNGYGQVEDDLLVHPADLFREVHRFRDPFDFHRHSSLLAGLRNGYAEDMHRAAALSPYRTVPCGRVFVLPPETWAKRVVGVFANQLSREQPDMAHATVLPQGDDSLLISVRAPLATRQGADSLCRQFATGGGRAAAAGINSLPAQDLDLFVRTFADHFCH